MQGKASIGYRKSATVQSHNIVIGYTRYPKRTLLSGFIANASSAFPARTRNPSDVTVQPSHRAPKRDRTEAEALVRFLQNFARAAQEANGALHYGRELFVHAVLVVFDSKHLDHCHVLAGVLRCQEFLQIPAELARAQADELGATQRSLIGLHGKTGAEARFNCRQAESQVRHAVKAVLGCSDFGRYEREQVFVS